MPKPTQEPGDAAAAEPVAKFANRAVRKKVAAVSQAKPAEPENAVKTAKPVKAAKPAVPAKPPAAAPKAERGKEKLVRDSFTMPRADFALIEQLKARALAFQRPAKKSELLRAGLQALAALSDKALKSRLDALPQLKTGRPRKLG